MNFEQAKKEYADAHKAFTEALAKSKEAQSAYDEAIVAGKEGTEEHLRLTSLQEAALESGKSWNEATSVYFAKIKEQLEGPSSGGA